LAGINFTKSGTISVPISVAKSCWAGGGWGGGGWFLGTRGPR